MKSVIRAASFRLTGIANGRFVQKHFSPFTHQIYRTNSTNANNPAVASEAMVANQKFDYPVARKDDTVEDDFHGIKVKDVYRWLEDPDSAETQAYVEEQNKISQPFLENCDQWQKFNTKLTKLWNFPKFGVPVKHGDFYYFYKNSGLQNHSLLGLATLCGKMKSVIRAASFRLTGIANGRFVQKHFSPFTHQIYRTNSTNAVASEAMVANQKFDYPVARKDDTVEDDFHGIKVKDVYRWLEDPDSAETQAYVEEQNKISQPFLENCDQWQKFNTKLTKLWNFPKFGVPVKHGDFYYFYKNSGLQNHSVLYQQETLTSEPKVFLDPNALSEDGTTALSQTSFSEDGNLFAYGLSESGSDWIKIKIRDVKTGKDFDETLEKVKFSPMEWTKDNKGIFYGRYPDQAGKTDGSETQQNENQKLYYHRIGEPQEKDVLVVEFPEQPTWRINCEVSDCGKYLLLLIVKDCRDNIVFYADLEKAGEIKSKLEIHEIVTKFESDYDYITNTGSKVYFRTNKKAPNYRVIVIDLENPAEENWTTLIKEHEKDVLDGVMCVNDNKLLLEYIRDVKSALEAHSLETGELIRTFDIDIGTIGSISGEKKYSEIFYHFTSFLTPGTIYHFDFAKPNEEPKIFREITLNLEGFDKNDYKVEQVFYSSRDDTKVPMFIIRKNKEAVTPRPCLLYGYGGFNISLQPSFGISGLMFIDTFDGVLAYPNLRGGGEYGEKWHNGGRLLNKQNVFDDFQTAAEYLINNNYTSKDRIVIQGGSNGGLLVGACINQRPDLFGAAVAQVGVMDMLRFHKFTIGHAWCSDYGNPSEKEHFDNLYKYSPVHNVHTPKNAKEEYPSSLILTADHDDRVSPLHSLKFAAALQEAIRDSEIQKNPILLRVYSKAGHGAGKPTSKRIEEATDILTFMYKSLNVDVVNL